MKQINVNVSSDFERDLKLVMKTSKIASKSEALRRLVTQEAEKIRRKKRFDFHSLIGIGVGGAPNPTPKFKSEDDLWS